MKKILSIICIISCLFSVLVIPAFAVDTGTFTTQDCIDYGVHIDSDNYFITGVEGTYKVILKDGALSGSLFVFSDVKDFTFDGVFINKNITYNSATCTNDNLIYLNSVQAEKIVASNVVLEFIDVKDLTQVPATIGWYVAQPGDFD